jgi:probable rRNA maturation factor
MIHLQVPPEYKNITLCRKLKEAALAVLKRQKSRKTDLTIVITDDVEIQKLNLAYRNVNEPTDVLSFASGDTDPTSGRVYLGDIIISYPQALLQSKVAGHPIENELQLLVVHGVLHLLGYDHAEEAEKEAMWDIQGNILDSLGCNLARLPR